MANFKQVTISAGSNTYTAYAINSTLIKAFPSANRDVNFDPEAKLNTEFNFTHLFGTGINSSSYIKSYKEDGSASLLEVIINGYYFNIKLTKTAITNLYANSKIYLRLRLVDKSLIDNKNTKVLANLIDQTTEFSCLDTVIDGETFFGGLIITDNDTYTVDGDVSFLLLENQDWANGAFLPQIAAGTDANHTSIILNSLSNKAFAPNAIAAGDNTEVISSNSVAIGNHTTATGSNQLVFGKYNIGNNSAAEVVGGGTSSTRKNIRTLDWHGNEWIDGTLNADKIIIRQPAGSGLGSNKALYLASTGTPSDNHNEICTRPLIDATSARTILSTGTGFMTEEAIYQGLPFINNSHAYNSNNSYFAPITGGNNGEILIGKGENETPRWLTVGSSNYLLKANGNGNDVSWEDPNNITVGAANQWTSESTLNLTINEGNNTMPNIDVPMTVTASTPLQSGGTTYNINIELADSGITDSSSAKLQPDFITTTNPGSDIIAKFGSLISFPGIVVNKKGLVVAGIPRSVKIPDTLAGASVTAGLVSNGTQTFAGNKTFINSVYFGSGTGANITNAGACTMASYNVTSDIRLKENIEEYKCPNSILDLPIVEFDFKHTGSHHIGCIAQDLQKICPELVKEDENGYLSIEENKIVYLLIDEVKKLKKEVEELKNR